MNKQLVIVTVAAALLIGCASKPGDVPDFVYSDEYLRTELNKFRTSNNDILFFLMVNRQGKVVRSRIVKRNVIQEIADTWKQRTLEIEFKPAKPDEPAFRQFSYPVDLKTDYESLN